MVDDIRDHWPQRPDGKRDGLIMFSGDLFSPSVESSVTRGSHMVAYSSLHAPILKIYPGARHERTSAGCFLDRYVLLSD